MNQDLGKKPGSAMTRSELQEDRVHTLERKNRFQWKSNFDSDSELKKDFSSIGPVRKDTSANHPGPLSDRYSAQYRARYPEGTNNFVQILDVKSSTQLKCAAFEDEYQPLPSPVRFSLRNKRSPPCSKEGVRVTFAQGYTDDYPLKKSSSTQTEALPPSAAERPEAWCFSPYLSRVPPQWGSFPGSETLTKGLGRCGNISGLQPCSDLPETAAPDPKTELEPNSSSLYKGTSDLYGVTHLPEEAPRFRNFLEVSLSRGSSYRSHSLDTLLDCQWPGTQGSYQSHTLQRKSPPASPAGLESKDLQSLSSALSSTVSAYHPLTAIKNDPARDQEDLDLELRGGECLTRVARAPIAELSSVLRQLLDLVDQHWSGPRSLQINPQFLTPAYDLLASLVSPSTGQCEKGRSPLRKGVDKNGDKTERMKNNMTQGLENPDQKHQKKQPTHAQQQVESLKKRVAHAVEERSGSHGQIINSKPNPAVNILESGRQWDQCLQRQVEALREQERHFKQLEETMGFLQDGHRLLSSNNSHMEQLNKASSNPQTSTQKHNIRKATDGLSPFSIHLT